MHDVQGDLEIGFLIIMHAMIGSLHLSVKQDGNWRHFTAGTPTMHLSFFLVSLIFGWGASTNTCQNPIIIPSEGPTVCMPLDQYEKRSIGTKGEV